MEPPPARRSLITHHLLYAAGLDPENPASPLVEWVVKLERLWGTYTEAYEKRLAVWRGLRERSNAILELALYWPVAEQALRTEREALPARLAPEDLPRLWPMRSVADGLNQLTEIVATYGSSFRDWHAAVLYWSIGMAFTDGTSREVDEIIRRVLHLRPDENKRWALWEEALLKAQADWRKHRETTRSYLAQGVVWRSRELRRASEGSPVGLTARGGKAEERDDAKSVALDGEHSAADPMAEPLGRVLIAEQARLVPVLREKLNPRERELLAVLQEDISVADALRELDFPWSVWNGLKKKAARLATQSSSRRLTPRRP